MERSLIDKLFGIFKSEYEKINVPFYEDEAWKEYIGQYSDIHTIGSVWDLTEAVNHREVFKLNSVAIPNPSGCAEALILTRDLAEKILAFGLPHDMSLIIEEIKKRPVPRLLACSKK